MTFPSAACPPAEGSNPPSAFPITVAVPAGSKAIDVMAGAADIDGRYRFQANSFGATLGFSINAIGGTAAIDNRCYWSFLVKEGDAPATPASVGVSSYSICSPVAITLQYTALGCHAEDSC